MNGGNTKGGGGEMGKKRETNGGENGSDENRMEGPLPRRHSRQLGAVGVDPVPVELAASRVDVDVARAQPPFTLPGEADEPEEDDDGEGEVRLEEARGVVVAAPRWADGDVELV